MKILLIEDDPELADVIRRGLSASGHVVDLEVDGSDTEHVAATRAYDAIVLDVTATGREPVEVARSLRAHDVRTPLVILTTDDAAEAAAATVDAIVADYLKKPFVFDELEARLRSITRRQLALPRDVLSVADLAMDLATREVRRGERQIELSPRETAFLEYFMRNAGMLLTRKMLTDALWERDRQTASNVLDAYVRRLRQKLSGAGESQLIATIRGVGYRFRLH